MMTVGNLTATVARNIANHGLPATSLVGRVSRLQCSAFPETRISWLHGPV